MTHYKLTGLSKEPIKATTITQDDYKNIITAKNMLLSVLAFEDKFDILIENFIEFEQEILKISARRMISPSINYSVGQTVRSIINRRLVNLLSSARLYIDQTEHDSSTFNSSILEFDTTVKNLFSSEYDRCYEYRVMETIRNYAQHRDLPVHGLKFVSSRDPENVGEYWSFRIVPHLDVEKLEMDGWFKKKILNEMKNMGNVQSLLPLVRGYIESLGLVHIQVRALLLENTNSWGEKLSDTVKQVRESASTDVWAVHLVVTDEHGRPIERNPIFEDISERIKTLQEKNAILNNLSKRFVSSRHVVDDI